MAPPGRRRFNSLTIPVILGLFFLFSSTASAASAVLGVDLGTEYIKAALVKPGIPLEIVLTKDSKRKELSAVAFKPSKSGAEPSGSFPERFYGSDAVALAARFPSDVYPNLKSLLGIPLMGPEIAREYKRRYPAVDLVGLEDRPTIAIKSTSFAVEENPFTIEELLAMELKNVRENAKALAGKGTDVSDVVFTVPPFYTADEKRALEVAAKLAGLKVLGLVSDGLAVGINYATSRTFPVINEGGKPEYHMVFDMGAGSATATILKFQGRTVKDVGRFNKTVQEVQVIGTGWDRTLGGDSLNVLIMNDMMKQFVNTSSATKAQVDIFSVKTSGRTASKLWKESEKVRQVLSANTATSAFFESLHDDVDFRYKLSRTKFEELAADFASRVDGPVQQALATSGLTFDDLDSVILHGGAVRTPFVQKRLESLAGGSGKLKTNVNADEAAVFGAAFKAAGLSPSFRVKEIRDSDTQGYAVGVQYMWNLKDRLQKVFTPTSQVGTTKDLPFKMMGEFEFTLYQSVPSGGEELIRSPVVHFKSGNLTRVVTNLIDQEGCDRETFDTKVSVRLSPVTGLPEVLGAWVSCETDKVEGKAGVMDNVKNFFGMGGKKGDQEPLKEGEDSSETADEASSSNPESSSATSSATSSTSSASPSEEPEASDSATASAGKKKTVTSAITYHITQQGYEKHPRKEFKRMQDRLASFDASDKARRVREEVLNSLEAFTYRARDLLEDESFIAASTADHRSKLQEKLSAASDWIYEDGHSATEEVLNAKLKELKDLVEPVQKRKDEAAKRPAAIKSLEDAVSQINSLKSIVKEQLEVAAKASSEAEEASKSAASATSSATESASTSADPLDDLEDQDMLKSSSSEAPEPSQPAAVPAMYTEEDLKSLEDTASSVQKWMDEKLAAQAKLSESDDPAVLVKDLNERTQKLNNALMDIIQRKMYEQQKTQRPKPKASKKPKKPKKSSKKKDEEKAEKKADEEKVEEQVEEGKVTGDEEIKNENKPPLVKLEIDENSSEEEILAAMEAALDRGKQYQKADEKKHDEL